VGARYAAPRFVFALAALWFTTTAGSAEQRYASILIDDLGASLERSAEVIALPAPLGIAILPDTRYARETAELAARKGRDVILHMPMQSVRYHRTTPAMLQLHMSKDEFTAQLQRSLASVPHVKGVNNHMGSLLTRHPGHMQWLMQTLAEQKNLFFIDSRTTDKSVAMQIASEYAVPSVERDVFLDPDFRRSTISHQLDRFIALVREQGSGLAIAHPHPNTLAVLRSRLDDFRRAGIRLVPISEFVALRRQQDVTCTGPACAGL
jgi:polysaccharide deacetylase 2 family uncharacterized protein YibQ